MRRLMLTSTLALCALCASCTDPSHGPITTCESADGIVPDCRFVNPEDMVAAPQEAGIIVSQFGGMSGAHSGGLVLYAPGKGTITPLFPVPGATVARADGWGDPSCPTLDPLTFAPHGIDIEQLDHGAHAVYVVNHGGRESVELFEVTGGDGPPLALAWRGCVLAPADGYFNDVVVLRDGSFWVSQMLPRESNMFWVGLKTLLSDYKSGFVYRWDANGFWPIAGSQTGLANGLEKSVDERFLFVNGYLNGEVVKVDVVRGERVAAAAVASPDNLTWADGRLLAASHHGGIADATTCQALETGSCGFPFRIVAIDPETMASEVLLEHAGAPMGGATVALQYAGRLYLGTFAGDRIASTNWPP
jgi:hypothetical protein